MQRAIKSCQPEKSEVETGFSKKTKSTEPINQAPGNLPGACAVHRLRRCTADDGVNPMETVRLRLYRFLPFFSPSRRMAPINLSLRVSRPSLFRIVPGGRPFFFSNAPTVQSLRVCLAMENLLSKTLKWTESEMNGYCRFADLTVVLILNGKLKFQPCNFGKVADIELIGDFDVKNRKFSVQ